MATTPEVSYKRIVEAYSSLGDIDGIQSPAYDVSTLPAQWLSRVKVPGRELPDDELWQVDEAELMTLEDYDEIVTEGFGPWLQRILPGAAPGEHRGVQQVRKDHPRCACTLPGEGDRPFTPAVGTIPYEYFCGGRSMKTFLIDLFRHADKVQAAMDAALPVLIENLRGVIRGLRPHGRMGRGLALGQRVHIPASVGTLRLSILQGDGGGGIG